MRGTEPRKIKEHIREVEERCSTDYERSSCMMAGTMNTASITVGKFSSLFSGGVLGCGGVNNAGEVFADVGGSVRYARIPVRFPRISEMPRVQVSATRLLSQCVRWDLEAVVEWSLRPARDMKRYCSFPARWLHKHLAAKVEALLGAPNQKPLGIE